jgi:phosphoglycerate dehydrogenase-like enzyme
MERGSGGAPKAIAISPVLMGGDPFEKMQAWISRISPSSRLIPVNSEGVADEPLDEVEVLLRGWGLRGASLDRVVSHAPALRWIHSAPVGVEEALTPLVRKRDLVLTNGRTVYDRPIAEYTLTMILAICRRLPALFELQREATWQPLEAREMSQITVGLVGLGGIAGELARLLRPFGTRVVAVRRRLSAAAPEGVEVFGGLDALPRLMSQSDFVLIALPLTPETDSVIGEEVLAAAKPGSWLINVARGALVDDRALLRALQDGPLGGAVLDAFRQEPLPPSSPFYRLSNCIVTPHTSWNSPLILERVFDVFCENLERYCAGLPLLHVVDQSAGY